MPMYGLLFLSFDKPPFLFENAGRQDTFQREKKEAFYLRPSSRPHFETLRHDNVEKSELVPFCLRGSLGGPMLGPDRGWKQARIQEGQAAQA